MGTGESRNTPLTPSQTWGTCQPAGGGLPPLPSHHGLVASQWGQAGSRGAAPPCFNIL